MTRTATGGRLSDDDLFLFGEGTHDRLAEKLGAHLIPEGTWFGVWAPNAEYVSVIGDLNGWDREAHPLEPVASSGIWAGVVEGAEAGQVYKFHIRSRDRDYHVDKADPFGFRTEVPPKTGTVIWDLDYDWGDDELPDPRLGSPGHRHRGAVPPVEVTDQPDFAGVRRPHREPGAFALQLSAEGLPEPVVLALADEVQVQVAQR